MKALKRDTASNVFYRLAYRVHPKLAQLYDAHTQFFNDGFVELVCLLIANAAIAILSYYYIGLSLAAISICLVTPITFGIKYVLHKFWVWVPDDKHV